MYQNSLISTLHKATFLVHNGVATSRYLPAVLGTPDMPPDVELFPRAQLGSARLNFGIITVGVCDDPSIKRYALLDELTQLPCQMLLREGPSYLSLGQYVGGPLNALRLIALGWSYALWDVFLPEHMDIPESLRLEAAALGMICMSGYPTSALRAVASG